MTGCGSQPIKTDNALSGSEIKALLGGKTFDIESWKDWDMKEYYDQNGAYQ